jgi:ATP-binding cassette subfamily F protein uup
VTLGLDGSGRVDIVAGGYEDWARQKSSPAGGAVRRALADAPRDAQSPSVRSADSSPHGGAVSRKLTYKDQRDLDRLPAEIERLEGQIAALEEALHDANLYARDPDRFADLTARAARLRADKHSAEERWLEVAELAESLVRQASAEARSPQRSPR